MIAGPLVVVAGDPYVPCAHNRIRYNSYRGVMPAALEFSYTDTNTLSGNDIEAAELFFNIEESATSGVPTAAWMTAAAGVLPETESAIRIYHGWELITFP